MFQLKSCFSLTDSGVVWRQHSDLLDLHQSRVSIIELHEDLVISHGHHLGVGADDGAGEEADVG